MTASLKSDNNPYFSRFSHRVLSVLTWLLFLAGMLAWFVQGANRPLDPVLSSGLVLVPLVVRRVIT